MSRYVIGDIHGCYSKFSSVLNKVNFDPKNDILYSVGDFADRGEPEEIAKTLIYLNNLHSNYPQSFQPVFGNHDFWLYQWFEDIFNIRSMDRDPWETWEYNGGRKTMEAVESIPEDIQRSIYEWMGNLPYRIELEDCVIQHTTLRPELLSINKELFKTLTLKECLDKNLCARDYDSWFWDREAIHSSVEVFGEKAIKNNTINRFDKLLITGHTPLIDGPYYDKDLNLISIDTGSFITKEKYNTKRDGEICILNLDTLNWIKSNGERGDFNV